MIYGLLLDAKLKLTYNSCSQSKFYKHQRHADSWWKVTLKCHWKCQGSNSSHPFLVIGERTTPSPGWTPTEVCYLIGILSRVNHKRLHHGWKQCLICLPITLHASHQTTNYSKTTKLVLYTHLYKTKHTQTSKTTFSRELVPPVSPLLKKHMRLGHAGIVDHSVDLSIPDFKGENPC